METGFSHDAETAIALFFGQALTYEFGLDI